MHLQQVSLSAALLVGSPLHQAVTSLFERALQSIAIDARHVLHGATSDLNIAA
jgi:hypothetical protein